MNQPIALYAAAAALVTLLMAVLVIVLIIQRRRHRQLLLLALAQEQADRRRKKRKKAGLHRWEIDLIAPEALVAKISNSSNPLIQSFSDAPDQYLTAVTQLRRDDKISPQSDVPLPLAILDLPSEHTTCPICLEDLQLGHRARVLPCQHIYHSQCIRVWLRRKNACPCCCERVLKRRKKRVKIDPQQLDEQQSPSHPDRPEHVTIDIHSVEKTSFSQDRPRPPPPPLQRSVSLLDPADPDSEMLASEASSAHLDEPPTHDLLQQVRNAMRGGPSMHSVATSVDEDHSDDEMQNSSRKSSSLNHFQTEDTDPQPLSQDLV